MRRVLCIAASLLAWVVPVRTQPVDPTVRIGLNSSAPTVTIRSSQPFAVEQNRTRSAKFTSIMVMESSAKVLTKDQVQYRMLVEIDGNKLIVLPMTSNIRMDVPGARIEFDGRTYRGIVEVVGNARNTFTVINELPMEEYLLGVVPNELSPRTFGKLEALKAQAVAARTYIVRNMGQYKKDGFDICNSDACQVYFGAGTEDPLATQAVVETRGVIATYNGQPINALYSSTCGGHTENAENIFDEKLPYLRSVMCEYRHAEPKPFSTSQLVPSWQDAVLRIANVANYSDARRFLGISGSGEPPARADHAQLAKWIRETFYPNVRMPSDADFLAEQGIFPTTEGTPLKDVLYRLIDKKGALEFQQGVLQSWDGETATLVVNGGPVDYKIRTGALIFQRVGEERIAMSQGLWIGGELLDFRAVDGAIEMLVYRKNFVTASADRFSRLAMWQVHKTKAELEAAVKPLNIGELKGFQVIERGPSERPISTEIIGTTGRTRVRALRFRSLFALRDSLAYFDEERNAKGELIGMSFYGQGWGHGVGMCQVGAFGMALDGAMYDEILKKYYTGIELKKLF